MNDTLENLARAEAREFIDHEQQFHLGFLPTEQSHPKTRDFSRVVSADSAAGARMLLSVDYDIIPVAERVLRSPEFALLESTIYDTAKHGGRIAFSGCGATGRLAIILEKLWRVFWEQCAERDPHEAERLRRRGDLGYSIMTGGDRALIRSVENFEDYQSFGRRQVTDAGLGGGDLLVAITEGGETSSVIGTALEARARGAAVFFVYNNPTAVLAEKIERSRVVIETAGITKIDLFTGPMALSGSTRMQATSSEMLVVGAALERAARRLLDSEGSGGSVPRGAGLGQAPHSDAPEPADYVPAFRTLLDQLSAGPALDGIASLIDLETGVYRKRALVTYLCDDTMLDIISDTTERTPTFMLPPFRKADDATSPPSWAFTKDPARETREAWRFMLRREPRGLVWNADDYRAMGASDRIVALSPKLDLDEILGYAIGNERDASRSSIDGSVGVTVRTVAESQGNVPVPGTLPLAAHSVALTIGQAAAQPISVPLELPRTPLDLLYHLAIKLVFNTASTAAMGKLGRIQGNWMIQLDPTNKKLVDRATRIVSELAGLSYEAACLEVHRTIVDRRESARRFDQTTSRYDQSAVTETLSRLGVQSLPGQ